MLSVTYAECHLKAVFAECRFAEYRFSKCCGAKSLTKTFGYKMLHLVCTKSYKTFFSYVCKLDSFIVVVNGLDYGHRVSKFTPVACTINT
jgi:hypothetical protein